MDYIPTVESWFIAPTHLRRKLVSSPAHDGDCVIEGMVWPRGLQAGLGPGGSFFIATRADVVRGRCARLQSVLLWGGSYLAI